MSYMDVAGHATYWPHPLATVTPWGLTQMRSIVFLCVLHRLLAGLGICSAEAIVPISPLAVEGSGRGRVAVCTSGTTLHDVVCATKKHLGLTRLRGTVLCFAVLCSTCGLHSPEATKL